MSKPEDIPQDVWDAAESVLKQIVYERVAIDGDSEVTIGGIDLIARAIMAETEACARVADAYAASGIGVAPSRNIAYDIRKRGEPSP